MVKNYPIRIVTLGPITIISVLSALGDSYPRKDSPIISLLVELIRDQNALAFRNSMVDFSSFSHAFSYICCRSAGFWKDCVKMTTISVKNLLKLPIPAFGGIWLPQDLLQVIEIWLADHLARVATSSRAHASRWATDQKLLHLSSTLRGNISDKTITATGKPRHEVPLASNDPSRGALQYTL